MKQFIEYYYKFINITLHKNSNVYYFYSQNNKYNFVETERTFEEINSIYNLLLSDSKYNKIILNINKSPISMYNNKSYVLIKLQYDEEDNIKNLYNREVFLTKTNHILLRENWMDLISKKMDYIEYQIEHIASKYPIIASSINYFIGMSENAISYMKNVYLHDVKRKNDNLCICHKRINSLKLNDYYNPLNIVIDHKTRDVSEYLKYIFLKDKYNISILNDFFNSLNLNIHEYKLLYARMMYPSFYFDIYENIVNSNEKENKILVIIKRTDEYERYLNEIYKIINKKIKIPKIDWV